MASMALQTEGLSRHFGGVYAANDVALRVERGARHALIGPNGAGKTTLINLLTGVLRPTRGTILLQGRDITALPAHRRVAGSRAAIDARIADILERFHLADAMLERTSALPYGKQRLLEIALAIACAPQVLLLDEPAAGVPEEERHEILGAVAALPRDVTVLFIEHDMDLVFSFAERISVLVNGVLFAEGSPDEMARDARVQAVYLGEEGDENEGR